MYYKHGDSGGRRARATEYRSWNMMLQRCNNPKMTDYHLWGGRGIKVCERWRIYENFLEDMGRKPTPKHSLDRINNDGDYEPGNCRWATWKEQCSNKRPKTTHKLHMNNKTGHTGIILTPEGRYRLRLGGGKERKHMGMFDTLEEAVKVKKEYCK